MAGYVNGVNVSGGSASLPAPTISTGTFSYLDAGNEQTILEVTAGTDVNRFDSIWIDATALTQDGTFKIYFKVDGTNYRLFATCSWLTSMEDGIYLPSGFTANDDVKITYEEANDEGADRGIVYNVVYTKVN